MKRILINTLAAVALFASPAIAQDGNFDFVSGSTNRLNFTGEWNADYAGGDVLTPPALGTAFAIFCVDPYNYAGGPYDAWVTAIALPNAGVAGPIATQTRLGDIYGGANAYARYWRATWLVTDFIGLGPTTLQMEYDYQQAIWEVTRGYTGGQNANSMALAAAANGTIINPFQFRQWGVITDVAALDGDGKGKQEFIFLSAGDRNLEIVPEPATMSLLAMGLAGMAGAGMRRRKK